MSSAAAGVDFDFFGNGQMLRVSWTARNSDDAWLVLDRNRNGRIDSAKEMFGNVTPQPESSQRNGFAALGVFDLRSSGGNRDGQIDSRDDIFSSLRLWQDKNHDAISQPAELHTLPSLGVVSIDLRYRESSRVDQYGNAFRFKSRVEDSQHSQVGRWAYDVFLVFKRTQ